MIEKKKIVEIADDCDEISINVENPRIISVIGKSYGETKQRKDLEVTSKKTLYMK